jgi:hypothetical protein
LTSGTVRRTCSALVLSGVLLVVACDQTSVEPSAVPATVSPAPSESVDRPTPQPQDVVAWQRFRSAYGLRSDDAWTLAVANDPSHMDDLGVPLLRWELDRVSAANLAAVDLVPRVQAFGLLFEDSYAGAYIKGPLVVVQFTDQIDERRAGLATLLGQRAPIDVRQVRYSLNDLDVFTRQVEADRAWFTSIGAELTSASAREQDNIVELTYKANDRDLGPQIRSHFGDADWLTLTLSGPLPWTGGYGRLVVKIVDQAGRPVEAGVLPTSADERVSSAFIPMEVDGLYEEERIEAIVWEVIVTYFAREDERSTTVMVRVPENGVGSATVVVER